MEKIVCIVNGKPRAGKDTFAELLNDCKDSNVFKYSSIQKVKYIAHKCGWHGGKDEKDRKFLSDLKILTTHYSDMAFEDIREHVKWFKLHGGSFNVMLIDIREPKEIARAVKEFGAISVFIDNKKVKNVTSNMADANVEKYKYDYVVSNNGTINEFKEEINKFYNGIINGGK